MADQPSAPRALPGAPGWILADTLFIQIALLFEVLVATSLGQRDNAWMGLDIAIGLQVFVTLYDGRFGAARTISWLLLIAGSMIASGASFFFVVLPLGQLSFWAAAKLTRIVGEAYAQPLWFILAHLSTTALPTAALLLGLDLATTHLSRLQRWPPRVRLAFAAAAIGAGTMAIAAANILAPSPPASLLILPPFTQGAYYALLRAVPDKTGAVITVLVVLLAPAIWPWMRVAAFHRDRRRRTWTLLWLGFGAVWLLLTWLGLQAPDDRVVGFSRAAAIYVALFFAAAPPMLHLWPIPAPPPRE